MVQQLFVDLVEHNHIDRGIIDKTFLLVEEV